MRYKVKPGIILTNICDEHFLVSCKEARIDSPYITKINETAAYIWQQLCKGSTDIEILESIKNNYEIEKPDQIEKIIKQYIDLLIENNMIVIKEEE